MNIDPRIGHTDADHGAPTSPARDTARPSPTATSSQTRTVVGHGRLARPMRTTPEPSNQRASIGLNTRKVPAIDSNVKKGSR